MLPALSALPGHLLWRARMRVASGLAEVLPAGIDVHAYAVLRTLDDAVPRSQQDLALAVGVSRTTISTVVTRLLGEGLVERVRNPEDLRSYLLTRTGTGTEAVARWTVHVDAVARHLAGSLTEAEHVELRDLLDRVAAPDLSPTTAPQVRASLGFLLTRIHEGIYRDVATALAPIGIEPGHFGALVALEATGPVAQAGLAHALGLSGARVVGLVDDLEQRDLVERRRSPVDRRTHLLHLRPDAPASARPAHATRSEQSSTPRSRRSPAPSGTGSRPCSCGSWAEPTAEADLRGRPQGQTSGPGVGDGFLLLGRELLVTGPRADVLGVGAGLGASVDRGQQDAVPGVVEQHQRPGQVPAHVAEGVVAHDREVAQRGAALGGQRGDLAAQPVEVLGQRVDASATRAGRATQRHHRQHQPGQRDDREQDQHDEEDHGPDPRLRG